MANPFADPEMNARLLDLLDHRLDEAKHFVTLAWGTPLESGARHYLDAISTLIDRARAVSPRQQTPTVAGTRNADLLSGDALDRSSQRRTSRTVDRNAQVDTVSRYPKR